MPAWFPIFFILFILCFLTIKELYVDIVVKELMSHKVCNFISRFALFFFLIVAHLLLALHLAPPLLVQQDVLCL